MRQALRELPRRLRAHAHRLADEAVLSTFGFEVPVGPTLVIVADAGSRSELPIDVQQIPSGETRGLVTLVEVDDQATHPVHIDRAWESVVLVAADRAGLRRVVGAIPRFGLMRQIAVLLTSAERPLGIHPRGEWPRMAELESRRFRPDGPGVLLRVKFHHRATARAVLVEIAVQNGTTRPSHPGLFTGYLHQMPEQGLDAGARIFASAQDTVEHELVVPVDVLVAATDAPAATLRIEGEHHVLGRAPVVVAEAQVQPVDEGVFNPVRWVKRPDRPAVDLADLVVPGRRVTESDLYHARYHHHVDADLATADVQDVLRLAMGGVPVQARGLEEARAAGRLAGVADTVLDTLAEASSTGWVDLSDALEREEYSLRLRRATFDAHSTLAHRAARSAVAGVERQRAATAGLPAISLLLATRREHELPNAIANVRKQIGVEIELVVATHGFSADETKLRDMLGDEHGLTVLGFDADARFGDVLTAAAQAAAHDVLMKMDDDDWYSPHAVHDLLMARHYSGADLVGMPTEFVHLVGFDQTVWRREPSETFAVHVAGGTMTLSKDLLREVGWFRPVRRWVDAQLLAAVAALGGSAYRTHGLGYVLVRHEEGHTWTLDPEEFRRHDQVERLFDGFRPPGSGRPVVPGASA
ncbi:glycosyltransferase family 2 protein [Nocardioides yefusunii]|uniref:Glycosyltransferase n=1 Tax=Nocardioides yefusunii TaxID=2500546 RepID=A0ABW1QZS5_9ACTN|nr:glycosyltransferase [Nocardioides yefusunii]